MLSPLHSGTHACPGWHLFSDLQEQIQNYLGGLKKGRSRSHSDTCTENTVINSSTYRRRKINMSIMIPGDCSVLQIYTGTITLTLFWSDPI